jgi:hypothetical protein
VEWLIEFLFGPGGYALAAIDPLTAGVIGTSIFGGLSSLFGGGGEKPTREQLELLKEQIRTLQQRRTGGEPARRRAQDILFTSRPQRPDLTGTLAGPIRNPFARTLDRSTLPDFRGQFDAGQAERAAREAADQGRGPRGVD